MHSIFLYCLFVNLLVVLLIEHYTRRWLHRERFLFPVMCNNKKKLLLGYHEVAVSANPGYWLGCNFHSVESDRIMLVRANLNSFWKFKVLACFLPMFHHMLNETQDSWTGVIRFYYMFFQCFTLSLETGQCRQLGKDYICVGFLTHSQQCLVCNWKMECNCSSCYFGLALNCFLLKT